MNDDPAPPSPESLALAQHLGYLSYDAALHRLWSEVRFPLKIVLTDTHRVSDSMNSHPFDEDR